MPNHQCPACGKSVRRLIFENNPLGPYTCPYCQTVLRTSPYKFTYIFLVLGSVGIIIFFYKHFPAFALGFDWLAKTVGIFIGLFTLIQIVFPRFIVDERA